MFSTSPESPKLVYTPRHSTPVWSLLDSRDVFQGAESTGTIISARDFSKSTVAETSGLSYNSCGVPINELFSNG